MKKVWGQQLPNPLGASRHQPQLLPGASGYAPAVSALNLGLVRT